MLDFFIPSLKKGLISKAGIQPFNPQNIKCLKNFFLIYPKLMRLNIYRLASLIQNNNLFF